MDRCGIATSLVLNLLIIGQQIRLHSFNFAANVISRDRFLQLLSILRLNNNEMYILKENLKYDSLYFMKVSTFLFSPAENLCVDKAI